MKYQRILIFTTNFTLGRNVHRTTHYTVLYCWPKLDLQDRIIITCTKNRTEQLGSQNAVLGYACRRNI